MIVDDKKRTGPDQIFREHIETEQKTQNRQSADALERRARLTRTHG